MKIDMSPGAVTLRLRQTAQLRQVCLALATSNVGLEIQRKNADNPSVRRTMRALGRAEPAEMNEKKQ